MHAHVTRTGTCACTRMLNSRALMHVKHNMYMYILQVHVWNNYTLCMAARLRLKLSNLHSLPVTYTQ